MDEQQRGAIYNYARARQQNSFVNLRFGNITPTDIDGMIDFGNNVFVIIEIKYLDAEMKTGQRLAIERLTDALQKAGKQAIAILASHSVDNPEKDVDVSICKVFSCRYMYNWQECNCTVSEIINSFLSYFAPKYLNKN